MTFERNDLYDEIKTKVEKFINEFSESNNISKDAALDWLIDMLDEDLFGERE